MAGITSPDQIVREDLSEAFLQSDVRMTPVTSRVKKGSKLTNIEIYSWPIETMGGRVVEGVPEGKDVVAFEGDKQERLYNRPQKFRRTPKVSDEANEINVSPNQFGKYAKLVTKKIREQQRDVEQRYLDDNDSKPDDGVRGYEFKGMGMVINDQVSVGVAGAALTSTDPQTDIPPAFRTPTAQIYTGNLIDVNGDPVFTSDTLVGMLASRYNNLGQTTELIMYADSVLKTHIGKFFGKYAQNVQGYTAIVQTPQQAIEKKTLALYGVDVINTDYGPMMVELMQWAPKTSTGEPSGRGYMFNFDQLQLRPSGKWLTHKELENQGGGPRGYIDSIIGHEYGDPRTHLKIDPVAVQGS